MPSPILPALRRQLLQPARRLLRHVASLASPPPRCALRVVPASPQSAREAPTPLVCVSGLLHGAAAWQRSGLPAAAAQRGYSVGYLDLPGFGAAPSGWRAPAAAPTLDALVDAMQLALAPLHAAPIVVAPSIAAPLMQKYLESFPLAALVAVAPLPPQPAALVRRILGEHAPPTDAPLTAAALQPQLAAWLRRIASDPAAAARLWLSSRGGGDGDEDGEAALQAELEVLSAIDAGGSVCGLDAAAAWLALLATSDPVRLEPQPVPMLALFGAADALLLEDDRLDTVRAHDLPCAPSLHEPADAQALEDAVAGDVGALALPGGHDMLHGDAAAARQLGDIIMRWVEKRF